MTINSKQFTLDTVIPGMVLSDDLLDDQGRILLPEGTTLSEDVLASIARHNITIVPILCEAWSTEDAAAALQRHQARLAKLFRKHVGDEDEATELLLQYMTHYRAGAMP